MSKLFIEESSLTAIGDAIRSKTGSEELLSPAEMAAAISGLETGGGGFWDEATIRAVVDRSVTNLTLPEGLGKVGTNAFHSCAALNIQELPESLFAILGNAFYGCKSLTLAKLPSKLQQIGGAAFYNCTGLTTLTFKGAKVTYIAATAFSGCTNLTEIKVPWAEGAVANAPWGATNATITYNYTEEG